MNGEVAGTQPDRPARRGAFWLVAIALLLFSAVLRFAALDRFPLPINQDELSNIYDGWCLAEIGADRHGAPWPFVLRGFGATDYRPALCAWLNAIPGYLVGFSVAGGRAMSGVVGVVSIALAALWAYRSMGWRGAILAIVFLGVTPWHLLYSRMAHEGAILPAVFTIGIILALRAAYVRSVESKHAFVAWFLSGLLIGLSTNVYAATRLTAVLFALVGVVLIFGLAVRSRVHPLQGAALIGLLGIGALIGAAPQLYAFADYPVGFLGRANTEILRPQGVAATIVTYGRGFLVNLYPTYLFASFGWVSNLSVARCTYVMGPLFYLGLLVLVWPSKSLRGIDRFLLLASLVVCIIPSAITRDSPNALRASSCCLLVPLIAVVGLNHVVAWLSSKSMRRVSQVVATVVAMAVLVEGMYYVRAYVTSSTLPHASQQFGLVRLGLWLRDNNAGYDRVCVELPARCEQPDIYVAAFTGMTPQEYLKASRAAVEIVAFDRCIRLNQYYFMSRVDAARQWNAVGQNERWLVVSADLSFKVVLERK